MSKQASRHESAILLSMALCMAMQMTGFVMILPLFARRFENFGAGVEVLGMSAMAYALTSTVASPFIGMLADRIGRRPIILVSLGAYVLAFSGYLFAFAAWQLVVLRGLVGIFAAGLVPAMMSVVGDLVQENQRARWIGIVSGGASFGWIIGPILGGFLYDRFGYSVPFTVSIVIAVGALLLAVFKIHEPAKPGSHPVKLDPTRRTNWQVVPAWSTLVIPLFFTFGVMFAWTFIEPQFMFYAYDDLGWTSSQLGLAMSTYGVAFMIGELVLGQLSDRLGRKPVLLVGLILFSAQFIGLVVFIEPTWIVISFILAGLGNALYDPALNALILDITPQEHTASVMGLKGTAGSLGSLLGPASVVLIAPFVSPQIVFLLAFCLVIFMTIISGFGLHPPEKKQSDFVRTKPMMQAKE